MKKLALSVCLFFITISIHAISSNYEDGNLAYEQKNYAEAIEIYEANIAQNGGSATVYYNLANAYYKINSFGKAVLNYERCLAIQPANEDAAFNLSLANLHTKDKLQPVNEPALNKWWRKFVSGRTPQFWGIIALCCIWISLFGFIVFRFAKKIPAQKTGFYSSIIAFLCFIFFLFTTFSCLHFQKTYRFAIILAPSATLKSEPTESSTSLMLLHEGLKLQILSTEESWTEVKLADGNVGWLANTSIESVL